jgi:hypothetical protein
MATPRRAVLHHGAGVTIGSLFVGAACTSSNNDALTTGTDGGVEAGDHAVDGGGGDAASATCNNPGGATEGVADTHCALSDGGSRVQTIDFPQCGADAGPDAGSRACPYGETAFGHEADDEDCKYHIKWTSDPVCNATLDARGYVIGTQFTLTVTNRADNSPLSRAAKLTVDASRTSPAGAGCDDSALPSFQLGATDGTYAGNIEFDQAGQWTIRVQIDDNCVNLPASPYGHVAFRVTVP